MVADLEARYGRAAGFDERHRQLVRPLFEAWLAGRLVGSRRCSTGSPAAAASPRAARRSGCSTRSRWSGCSSAFTPHIFSADESRTVSRRPICSPCGRPDGCLAATLRRRRRQRSGVAAAVAAGMPANRLHRRQSLPAGPCGAPCRSRRRAGHRPHGELVPALARRWP